MVRAGDASTRPEIGRVTGLGRGVVTQRVDQAIEMGYPRGRRVRPVVRRTRTAHPALPRRSRPHHRVRARRPAHPRRRRDARGRHPRADAPRVGHRARTRRDARHGARDDRRRARTHARRAGLGHLASASPGPSTSHRAGRSRRPSCRAGTGSTSAVGSRSATTRPSGSTTTSTCSRSNERSRRRDEHLDLIYCKVGSGIGAGLLSQGRIHRGANGAAGDIGHVRVAGSDALCRCGKVGCLEAVAGGWALVRDAEVAVAEGAHRRARAANASRASRSPPRRSPARPRTATPSRSRSSSGARAWSASRSPRWSTCSTPARS